MNTQGKTKNSAVNYWIKKSKYDLEAARAMYNAKIYPYTGFMCHQTI